MVSTQYNFMDATKLRTQQPQKNNLSPTIQNLWMQQIDT